MKVSKLIKELEAIKEEYGDLEVYKRNVGYRSVSELYISNAEVCNVSIGSSGFFSQKAIVIETSRDEY